MSDVLSSKAVQGAVANEQWKDEMVAGVAEWLMTNKSWVEMTKDERKACIRTSVSQVESEDELRERLAELGVEGFIINWHLSEPGDETGQEARMLVKALGGLVAKNGALVMIMTPDEQF